MASLASLGMWHSLRLRLVVGLAAGLAVVGLPAYGADTTSALPLPQRQDVIAAHVDVVAGTVARRGPRRWPATSRNDRRLLARATLRPRRLCVRAALGGASPPRRRPRGRDGPSLGSPRIVLSSSTATPVVGDPRRSGAVSTDAAAQAAEREVDRLDTTNRRAGLRVRRHPAVHRLRERLQTNGAAIVVATVFALLCALLLFDDPGRAPDRSRSTTRQPTTFASRSVTPTAPSGRCWDRLAEHCAADGRSQPIDQGRHWVFRLQAQGHGGRGDRRRPRRSRAGELALRHPRGVAQQWESSRHSASAPSELLNVVTRSVTHGTRAPRSIHATIVADVQHRGRAGRA